MMCWKIGSRARGTCASGMAVKAYFIDSSPTVSRLVGRSALRTRVVPALSSHRQPAVPFCLRIHPDATVPAATLGVRGLVSDGVLVANIVRDSAADFIHFVQCP